MAKFFCRGTGLAVAALLLPAAGWAEDYGSVQKWEGFYPTHYADTRPLPLGQTFWDDPVVKPLVTAALTPDRFKLLRSCWGAACTEDRLQLYDNMLSVHVCKKDSKDQRACQKWSAYVFIELDSGRTSICWNMMVPGDLEPTPASLWLWRRPSGEGGSKPVEACTSATAFQHAEDQKAGKPIGSVPNGLPGATIEK